MSGKQSDERPWSMIETELLRQLRGATASMRALQKHYFATRDRQVLGEARRAESIVDNCLRRLDELDAAITDRAKGGTDEKGPGPKGKPKSEE